MSDSSYPKTIASLKQLLADTYALQLKTQNYHWNVTGPNFHSLHQMFEQQYTMLFQTVDLLAERIRALGELSPGSFAEFSQTTNIKDGDKNLSASDMTQDLVAGNESLIKGYRQGIEAASQEEDSVTEDIFIGLEKEHEKTRWMLKATLEK